MTTTYIVNSGDYNPGHWGTSGQFRRLTSSIETGTVATAGVATVFGTFDFANVTGTMGGIVFAHCICTLNSSPSVKSYVLLHAPVNLIAGDITNTGLQGTIISGDTDQGIPSFSYGPNGVLNVRWSGVGATSKSISTYLDCYFA